MTCQGDAGAEAAGWRFASAEARRPVDQELRILGSLLTGTCAFQGTVGNRPSAGRSRGFARTAGRSSLVPVTSGPSRAS